MLTTIALFESNGAMARAVEALSVVFAQADNHIFLAQVLVKLGGFLAAARGEAAVRPALRRIQRASRNASIFWKPFEHEIDQSSVVRRHVFRPHARHQLHRSVHGSK